MFDVSTPMLLLILLGSLAAVSLLTFIFKLIKWILFATIAIIIIYGLYKVII